MAAAITRAPTSSRISPRRRAPKTSCSNRSAISITTSEKELIYYTLGEETWKTTDVWPPPGFEPRRYYFSENESLASEPPSSASGSDDYTVDFEVTTGTSNRWFTQRGGADVVYNDRSESDTRLLTYTSEPLKEEATARGGR